MKRDMRLHEAAAIVAAQHLEEANYLAQREFPVVGTIKHPTPWDLRHAEINDLLDQLDFLKAIAK